MSFHAGNDLCLGFFQTFWDEGLLPELPENACVLEIGCAEADWLAAMREARPDLYLVGIDCRGDARPAANEHIQGDVLTHEFPARSFDAIIAVSMIEWAGTGKYGDPIDPDGDVKTLQRARQWIKPGGWLYFDVPFSGDPQRNPPMRVYGVREVKRLLGGDWTIEHARWFAGRLETGEIHPDGPYMAHLLKPR